MSDQPNQPAPRNLSEISHLFLSSLREKQTQGAARPTRTPPAVVAQQSPRGRSDTIDLTPEEFDQVFGDKDEQPQGAPIGPVRAILASHLGPHQLTRVQQYAAHCCPQGKRVGLICVDASEFRLSIFEHNPHPHTTGTNEIDQLDPRKMAESLEELAWDVDAWLVLLPTPRAPEARSLLRDVAHWTMLTICDHDGVVACYRTLKGLSDLHRPRLSLATLDAASDADALGAFQRLSSVCRQFLDWPIESESPVGPSSDVTEHVVLWCCATRDKAQLATAPQWQVIADFLARAKKMPTPMAEKVAAAPAPRVEGPAPHVTEPAVPEMPTAAAAPIDHTSDVIDLPDEHASPASIVSAVLRGGHELVECPVKPPMCPEASLAVSRDHRLVLVAVARQGLSDLRQIGRAYQWLIENRSLIGMAVPQMSIDAHQLPRLHLLVDHADMSAEVLQPMLQSASVTVHAYRKLRWGNRTGLLLEAA
ncbi:MAG TPA: hypothetical protein VH518_20315 [Tepidisphaeraceae bacterium]|jgi:hypothetical protein